MKSARTHRWPKGRLTVGVVAALILVRGQAQTLLNVDFGAGAASPKTGFAATGRQTNDFWNLYSHYSPKFAPGMSLVPNGRLDRLKLADGTESSTTITVSNAPGVWGNATGDAMIDGYLFAPNGSNIVVTLSELDPGNYHVYVYGWAAPDGSPEQTPAFVLRTGTNLFGPLTASGASGWQSGQPWRERAHHGVFRDVVVAPGEPVVIEVVPGPGGVAVLNGLQILSRGTGPPRLLATSVLADAGGITNLLFREVRYTGKLGPGEARFHVALEVESRSTNRLDAVAFTGDLAILSPKLPAGLSLVNRGKDFILRASGPGSHRLEFEMVARVTRAEPWNHIQFGGPPAAVASVVVQSADPNLEIQLLSGTPVEGGVEGTTVVGVIGADRQVALRWQGRTAEAARDALVTVESRTTTSFTPAAIRHTLAFQYQILQARLSRIRILLPAGQALTRLSGEYVKDWQVEPHADGTQLTVEFIRPVEDAVALTLITEQPLPPLPGSVEIRPPQPLDVQRETGSLVVSAEDLVLRIENHEGLRQVDALAGEVASFRFNRRPASLRLSLARVEPQVAVAARVQAQLEEGRLTIRHELGLNVTRAGIYAIEFTPQPGCTVADVRGEGLEDWKLVEGRLRVNYTQRVLGDRALTVSLEQALAQTPPEFDLLPLRPAGVAKETAWIGAGSAAGIQLKTAGLTGAREVPVGSLPNRQEELLAFRAEIGDWRVTLSAARLAPRVVAQVFNLVTIGEGVVGGSATLRYGIVNQGVQQFRVRLPSHWRNLEFTGPNIRRKDQQDGVWTIGLQDKAWGGYTLVITYDHAFDPQKATLDAAGAHPLDVERETGALAITSAASLAIRPRPVAEPLRAIDPLELSVTDRALISRPVLLAYRYEGSDFGLQLDLTRHSEITLLDAVADRAQITSVLTDSGEMLTQASFLVKNNDRQYQRFRLPAKAELWGVTVNGKSVKAERDGDWVLVSLPRAEDRNEVFAVDLKYVEHYGALGHWFPRRHRLVAPETDVPGTYVEWELYTPFSKRVSGFGGNLTVARGTTHGLGDAWEAFVRFYRNLWHEIGAALIIGLGLTLFVASVVVYGRRRGFQGVVTAVTVFGLLAILAGMLLPALGKAKAKAQRITSVNNLKQIGLAARIYSSDNSDKLPKSFEEMMSELGTDKVLIDPETGQRYSYVGAGKSESDPNAILAYSSEKQGRREVLFADGSVQMMSEARFNEALAKDARSAALAIAQASQPAPGPAGPAQVPGVTPIPAQSPPAQAVQVDVAGDSGGATAPVATGIRSLRFELPKSGQGYSFTRVLSLTREPPALEVALMSNRVFIRARMFFQVVGFLFGLGLVWKEWRGAQPRAWLIAVGAGLALVGLASFLVAARTLHLALIVAVPAGILLVLLGLFRSWKQRRAGKFEDGATTPPTIPSAPAAAAWILSALLLPSQPAAAEPGSDNTKASVVSAVFEGSAYERSAQLEATLELLSLGTNQSLALFGAGVAVQAFSAEEGDARVWRDGEQVGVLLPGSGLTRVRFTLLVKLEGDASRRRLDFGLPASLGTRLTLTLAEPDAEVDFPGAVALRRTTRDGRTVIEAILGATDRLTVNWTPPRKRAADIAATVFARQTTLVSLGGGVVNTRAALEWQISQGELQQVQVLLPEGHRLLRVSGPHLRSWDLAATNRRLITVELTKPVSPTVNVVIETERTLESFPASAAVVLPRALQVERESGLVAVRTAEELGLTVATADGLQRIDNSEFVREFGDELLAVFSAWRFLRPDFDLQLRVEVLDPRVEGVAHQHFTVGPEQIALEARFNFTVSRAGVFALRLALPSEGRIESVQCDGFQSWSEQENGGGRVLDIALKQRTIGPLAAQIRLARTVTNLATQVELEGIHTPDAEKFAVYVTVSAEPGVGLKTAALSDLTEIPTADVPGLETGATGLLAFKHLATEQRPQAAWKLVLSTEPLDAWVRAEIVNHVTVGETLITGRSYVRYEIQNAPVKEFRLRVPDAWRNVEILGSAVRRRDRENGAWRVELQAKVVGEYRLTVTWEQSRSGTTVESLAGVQAVGVERETGAIGLAVQGELQLVPRKASTELLRIDTRELPDWTNHGGARPALCYRYLRPGWQLETEIKRFEDAALLEGLVDKLKLRTVIADDGQQMTQVELTIRNNGRQSLAVALPSEAEVWSAFVDGQPVRPARQGERLLLPLEPAGADDAPIPVEFTFVGRVPFPRRSGRVELASPRLDLPLKDARWELFLPPDFAYKKFRGTMTYESSDLVPISQGFTLAEYRRQEQAKQETFEIQALEFLRRTKNEISSGNYENLGKLSRYTGRQVRDQVAQSELQQLEVDFNRAQRSNLVLAQNDYALENARRYGLDPGAEAKGTAQALGLADERIAEQQITQLQKAQAVAVTRVEPLRVNLPTHGVRYSFVQVLQTQADKPLTIRFAAKNNRASGWFQRAVAWGGALVALWMLAGFAVFMRPERPRVEP